MTVVPLHEGRQGAVSPRTHKVILEDLAVHADIGFHDFEIGTPQRLLATVSVTLDLAHWPSSDTREASWNYDFIRSSIIDLIRDRRFNLQETLAEEIFALIAQKPGVIALSVWLKKPDVYPDARAVGVLLSSE
ncbi:dihydroneopterin aldolase [Sandaracinobacter sp. RS1-74]|uniref:dihydroneopterin aldolase n=1 Tax=Sandaracinobacteroides sayramensis TaxID=2913411 RepID=UPI001EDA5CE7|nr:dihydroneopterin aldolase [Sandaracinobacteroides sayramensis]MCG2841334.1 dihydroneopterin aldolase [Sandaracinobacteroides sayramensis]